MCTQIKLTNPQNLMYMSMSFIYVFKYLIDVGTNMSTGFKHKHVCEYSRAPLPSLVLSKTVTRKNYCKTHTFMVIMRVTNSLFTINRYKSHY